MAVVQVSFLGRMSRQPGREGYQRARYRFPDGEVEETEFFGFALMRRRRPARLVVAGTTGSMWHTLLEITGSYEERAELWERLEGGFRQNAVAERDLKEACKALSAALGVPVDLVLIPYGRDEAEQTGILAALAGRVERGERIELDVTHGLRHLPMLALAAAVVLRALVKAKVEALWYGAFELRDAEGVVPVLNLGGLMELMDWAAALERLEAAGDYGQLARLLRGAALPEAASRCLERAAFLEQVCAFEEAREQLIEARHELAVELPPVAELFRRRIAAEMKRIEAADLAAYQFELADRARQRRDYVRAASLLYEAMISAVLPPGTAADNPKVRQAAAEFLRDRKAVGPEASAGFARLSALRNALVHGTNRARRKDVRAMLEDPQKLDSGMGQLFRILRPILESGWPDPFCCVKADLKLQKQRELRRGAVRTET